MSDPFADLPRGHFGAILADPPWRFRTWNGTKVVESRGSGAEAKRRRELGLRPQTVKPASVHYHTMAIEEICELPVADIAAKDCALFLWTCWPMLNEALAAISFWGFDYKTCAFDWMKAHTSQLDMLRDDGDPLMGMGYWTRSNSEPCLLATRGKPKRVNADVRQGIIEPRRGHSRKPDCVHERIERLVAGPYLELFARTTRPGWTSWGNETNKFTTPETLVERARAYEVGNLAVQGTWVAEMHELAAEIERLRAENERLQGMWARKFDYPERI